jgi:hypothetical protein
MMEASDEVRDKVFKRGAVEAVFEVVIEAAVVAVPSRDCYHDWGLTGARHDSLQFYYMLLTFYLLHFY